ncbi:MAG: hypothetical protein SGPRY_015001 [Prymnesium sp.]
MTLKCASRAALHLSCSSASAYACSADVNASPSSFSIMSALRGSVREANASDVLLLILVSRRYAAKADDKRAMARAPRRDTRDCGETDAMRE